MPTKCPRCTGPITSSIFVHRSATDCSTFICGACATAEDRILSTDAPLPAQTAWPLLP